MVGETISRKNQAVEFLRIVSSFGIVWFHADIPGHAVAYSSLTFFLATSTYFTTKSRTPGLLKHFARLLVPYGFWYLIYTIFNLIAKHNTGIPNGFWTRLLVGPSIHLWYLTFSFFALVVIDYVKIRGSLVIMTKVASVMAFIMAAAIPVWCQFNLTPPFGQYLYAIVPSLVGVALATSEIDIAITYAIVLILAALMGGNSLSYAIGLSGIWAALTFKDLVPDWLDFSPISSCAFGVYLVHPIVYTLIRGMPPSYRVMVTFLVSLAVTRMVYIFAPRGVLSVVFGEPLTPARGAGRYSPQRAKPISDKQDATRGERHQPGKVSNGET